jgi:hypothetical protein
MIRQAIAIGVLKSCEKNVSSRREECIQELVDTLFLLFPVSKLKDINTNVTKFVDSAIRLKNQMTEEQAIYRCFLLSCDATVTNAHIDLDDERISYRTMLFCTFPGLQRFVLNEDRKMEILTPVKAQGIFKDDNIHAEMKEEVIDTERVSENVKDTTTIESREERGSSEIMAE